MITPVDVKVTESKDKQYTGNAVDISWSDGIQTHHSSFQLRLQCPCANCKQKTPQGVLAAIRITAIDWVGSYAAHFRFSDGHNTGIYTYEFLRSHSEKKVV